MKYHRLVDLNNKCLFHVVLEIGKSKTKVMPDSVSGEDLLPGFQVSIFSLCPHMAFPW